jgi:TetR/AcrR family transcriptional regulator, repressor for neighboring sulfatase
MKSETWIEGSSPGSGTQPIVRPTGRDEVRAAILHAAARLFAAHGPNASLRDIAAEAGVNLGLIHRHFGNKHDLLQAVLDSTRRDAADVVASAPDAASAIRTMFTESLNRGQVIRTVAWLMLDGRQGQSLRHEYPEIESLRAMVGDDPDARARLMAAYTMIYGWTIFGTQQLEAFGYAPNDRAAAESALAALLETVVTPTAI